MNRNRNQRRGMRERQQIKPKPVNNLSALGKNNLSEVLTKEWRAMLALAQEKPIYAVACVLTLLASLIAIWQFSTEFIARQGAGGNSQYYPDQGGIFSGLLSFFPGRVMTFLVLSLSLGWSIALIGIGLTKNPTVIKSFFAHIITMICAMFMVLCIDVIFYEDIIRVPIFVFLITIIGITLAVFLARLHFQQHLESNLEVTAAQAALLLNFSLVAAGFVLFSKATGLS